MRTEIAVFVLNLSDIIFLRTAPHSLPSTYGVEQGFSNYGSRLQMGLRNVILGREKNCLDKSNITIFVKFRRHFKAGLQ